MENILILLNFTFCLIFLFALLGQTLFSLDDLFLDLMAIFFRLKPQKFTFSDIEQMKQIPQKRIAVIVANWQEDEILEQMVAGNIQQIPYQSYRFYIGVYPNDEKTWQVARRLETKYPQVHVVVNDVPGPTSKGQMLNVMVKKLFDFEKQAGQRPFDLLLLQDSEDLIHPLSFYVFNASAEQFDFLQIPVFSLPRHFSELTGGTYMDEFAETHTKDLLVRHHLKAAIPSCGVGTAMSYSLVEKLFSLQNQRLLSEKTLTEDYHLGMTAFELGFQPAFICGYTDSNLKEKDWIATREYFPTSLRASIKQKTRWTLGIAFQGTMLLGWSKLKINNYFMLRDRRGPLNSFILLLSVFLMMLFFVFSVLDFSPLILKQNWVRVLMIFNLVHMIWRVVQRGKHVAAIYGWKHSLVSIARWPLSNLINCIAGVTAFQKFVESIRTQTLPRWDKTTHQIPLQFGRPRIAAPQAQGGITQGSIKTAMEEKS